jgi:glutamate-1-semialdehyde 2,1-aminomutase
MISVFFCDNEVTSLESASKTDTKIFNQFFHHLLENGVYLPPSAYESWFFSNALSLEDLDKTFEVIRKF